MMVYLYAYLATLAVFLPCDMVWLGTMASRLYRPTLGDILLSDANLPAAGAFYAHLSGRPGVLRGRCRR